VALTADGKRAVSGSEDSTLRVWDLEGKQPPRVLEGHKYAVNAVALTADGKRAVSGSEDSTLRVWDLEGNQPPRLLKGHTDGITTVALSADGRRAISGSKSQLFVWNLDTGSPPRLLEGHTDAITTVALSADGRRAISTSPSGDFVWNTSDDLQHYRLRKRYLTVAAALSADGKRCISTHDNELLVWNLDDRDFWGLENAEPPVVPYGHNAGLTCVALSSDGTRAISGSEDTTILVWDLNEAAKFSLGWDPKANEAENRPTDHKNLVSAVALSADGKRALSGSIDHTLIAWDCDAKHSPPLRKRWERWQWWPQTALALSADGACAISGSRSSTRIAIFDVAADRDIGWLEGHQGRVTAVALSADGKRALSVSDTEFLLWNLRRPQSPYLLAHRYDLPRDDWWGWPAVSLSFDGNRAVCGSDSDLFVWDLNDGLPCQKYPLLQGHKSRITAVALSADGNRVMAGFEDNILMLWDLDKNWPLRGHEQSVTAVAFSPDAKRAASGSKDSRVIVWDLERCESLAAFVCDGMVLCCSWAANYISPETRAF
jgi:WD40 repeat protein